MSTQYSYGSTAAYSRVFSSLWFLVLLVRESLRSPAWMSPPPSAAESAEEILRVSRQTGKMMMSSIANYSWEEQAITTTILVISLSLGSRICCEHFERYYSRFCRVRNYPNHCCSTGWIFELDMLLASFLFWFIMVIATRTPYFYTRSLFIHRAL
jgi:hypothetical protein